MLILKRLFSVCLCLSIFTYVVESFVLITANVDDLKKIARKFISNSVADQLADFIAKARVDAISEENENNANEFQQLSGEDNLRTQNIARQRNNEKYDDKSPTRTTSREKVPKEYIDNPSSERKTTRTNYKNTKETDHYYEKSRPKVRNDVNRNTKFDHSSKPIRQRHQYIQNGKNMESISNKREDKTTFNYKPTKMSLRYHQKISSNYDDSDKNYYNKAIKHGSKYQFDEILKRNQYNSKAKDVYRLVSAEDEVSSAKSNTMQVEFVSQNTSSIEDLRKATSMYISSNIHNVTTEREKTKFDRYEIGNYPKVELIATSGPVALPKVPGHQRPW